MKQKRPGPFIVGYLVLVGLYISLLAAGVIILSMDNVLGFKYEPYSLHIGVALVLSGILVLAISVKFLISGMRQLATNLDILFEKLSLRAEPHRLNGRHYFGSAENRNLEIYCSPVSSRRHFGKLQTIKYIGHSLDISVKADLPANCSIGLAAEDEGIQGIIKAGVVKLFTKPSTEKNSNDYVKVDAPDYNDLAIYTLDPEWTKTFLATPEIRQSLTLLLEANDKCLRQHIYLKQDQVHFRVFFNIRRIKKSDMEKFVENTVKIAIAAESISKEHT